MQAWDPSSDPHSLWKASTAICACNCSEPWEQGDTHPWSSLVSQSGQLMHAAFSERSYVKSYEVMGVKSLFYLYNNLKNKLGHFPIAQIWFGVIQCSLFFKKIKKKEMTNALDEESKAIKDSGRIWLKWRWGNTTKQLPVWHWGHCTKKHYPKQPNTT